MRVSKWKFARVLALSCAVFSAVTMPLEAANIVLDSASGTFTVNGVAATQINGVTVVDGGLSGGIRTFKVQGDLDLTATDTLTSTGNNGISLYVGNNVSIDPSAVITINAGTTGGAAGAGGGATGGTAGSGGAAGGAGGSIINGAAGPNSSTSTPNNGGGTSPKGGAGGHSGSGLSAGAGGAAGAASVAGGTATGGGAGGNGTAGSNGLNAGGAGAAGTGASGTGAGLAGTSSGAGGAGGGGQAVGGSASAGKAGTAGNNGGSASNASNGGAGGGGLNTGGVSTTLTGGGSGGSGAGGGGGGGGGGASSGSAGGGGGGGQSFLGTGGGGGGGGGGGQGTGGGAGGKGGTGGAGGAGGGAAGIIANGTILVQSTNISATGANGAAGGSGVSGTAAANGQTGGTGGTGGTASNGGGAGQAGGAGGNGGKGGTGGTGGSGGQGGGGAGGTILIQGTTVDGTGASVNVSGGAGGNAGGGGRFVFGTNASGGFAGTVLGAANNVSTGGTKDSNPFVNANPSTPFIPNLPTVGAEIYGIGNVTPTDVANALGGAFPALDVNNNSVSTAAAALVRLSAGSLPSLAPNFPGYDLLLYVSLTGSGEDNPSIGVGGPLQNLLSRGWANNPFFGGAGAQLITTIGSYAVYGTLIPDSSSASAQIQLTSGAVPVNYLSSTTGLTAGNVLYVVPEPGTWLLLGLGLLGLPFVARRRRKA